MPDLLDRIGADDLVAPDLAAHDLVPVATDSPYVLLWVPRGAAWT